MGEGVARRATKAVCHTPVTVRYLSEPRSHGARVGPFEVRRSSLRADLGSAGSVPAVTSTLARLRFAAFLVALVFVGGSFGYWLLGLSVIDAVYQTVTTVTTVGFRELGDFGRAEKIFTIVLIVVGVGTVLYTFTLSVQMVVEGQLREIVGRRRMDKHIAQLRDHVVLCGWGRVGRAVAVDLAREGHRVVAVDIDPTRLQDVDIPTVVGDATQDATLRAAGIERARALIAALTHDADNSFVTLSGRALNPDLFIVARARQDESIDKLTRSGADRVVNPQELGAARMASFVARPHVAEFVDVVMHERSMEFRMQEVEIPEHSPVDGLTLSECDVPRHSGALVLALRDGGGRFITNPSPSTVLRAHNIIIAVGTEPDLARLCQLVQPQAR
jgi:voltage-gated potassium channel